jgi:hypothetical protein
VVVAACSRERPEAAQVAAPTPPAAPAQPASTATPIGSPTEPAIDPRLIAMYPERYQQTEQVCDLISVGHPWNVTVREAATYPIPVKLRTLVRCAASTGSGWLDLVLRSEALGLFGSVRPGERIRVRIIGAAGGFEGHPIAELVAWIGPAQPTPEDASLAPVSTGDDLGDPDRDAVGKTFRCAIAWIAHPTPLASPVPHPYPPDATHRMDATCRHAGGEAWVDLVVGATSEPADTLSLDRGRVAEVELLRRRGGHAGHPIVRLRGRPSEGS